MSAPDTPTCCGREMFGPVGGGARGPEVWWCPDCHRRVPLVVADDDITEEEDGGSPDDFADFERAPNNFGVVEMRRVLAELRRENAALFADAQCEEDSHWEIPAHPVAADAICLGVTDRDGWTNYCRAHLPSNLPPDRVIWRLPNA